MHVSCIHAGFFLAKLGRPEVENCINALQQYSHAYEEMAERATEIKRVYDAAVGVEFDFTHMASVVPRPTNPNPNVNPNAHPHAHPNPSGFHPMEGLLAAAARHNSHSPAHQQQHQGSPLSQFPMTADSGFYA